VTRKRRLRSRRPRIVAQGAILVTAVCMALVTFPRSSVEQLYAEGVYPALRQVLTAVSSRTSLVLFDWLVVGGSLGILLWWGIGLVRLGGRGRLRVLAGLASSTVVGLATLYLVFLTTWGLNYRREALSSKLAYRQEFATSVALEELAEAAIGRLNTLFEETESSVWPQLGDLPDQLGLAFERAQRRLEVSRPARGTAPRRSLLTPYFRRAGIDGMVDPFFLQILVNDTVLPFERPFVTAHEWAHVAGFAHEGEANFVAWLTCLEGDERMQYSAWQYLVGRLLAAVSETARSELASQLGPGPRADYAAVRARLGHVVPVLGRNARRLNDRYLRANRVAGGVRSYAEVLLLAVGTELGRAYWPRSDTELPYNGVSESR